MSSLMFISFFNHIIYILITLEFLMINMIFLSYTIMKMMNLNIFFISILLTIMICESILGLTLLIYMVRIEGNDYIKNLNLMKW
uniref:NADH-ubiquinone oxidoreductase chain 4L n=1 Tax=Dinocampus coccinellae TaxID=144245 RepID=A0A343YVD1_9HYME|nr:NADH dehydrogenase subunit 4L [Dinocampus coccinellae]